MAHSIRVLLVEDSHDDAELIHRELDREGLAPVLKCVETRPDMESAIETGNWDIVISDYRLTGFNALTVLDTLKRMDSEIPLIMVSGGVDDFSIIASLTKGATEFVPKDNLADLGPAVRRVLGV